MGFKFLGVLIFLQTLKVSSTFPWRPCMLLLCQKYTFVIFWSCAFCPWHCRGSSRGAGLEYLKIVRTVNRKDYGNSSWPLQKRRTILLALEKKLTSKTQRSWELLCLGNFQVNCILAILYSCFTVQTVYVYSLLVVTYDQKYFWLLTVFQLFLSDLQLVIEYLHFQNELYIFRIKIKT